MISAKAAVEVADSYLHTLYGPSVQGLRVEEMELVDEEGTPVWHVTMGFWDLPPVPPSQNVLATFSRGEPIRSYKLIRVGADSGDVISMKIRSVPTAEKSGRW